MAVPCEVPDNGTGTVSLPPPGCGYVSPEDLHVMIDGLPPGDTIKIGAEHNRFFNVTTMPGGDLGGEVEHFDSFLVLDMKGTGGHAGYARMVQMQVQCETHTAPRAPGTSPQSFDTEMFGLQGQLPPGDPDFDLLRITAGNGFGMPSPGHTTLTQLPGGNWNVDSFFDITYRIDFIGHPGGPFGGMSGSTTGTIRMGAGEPPANNPPPCTVVDNGTGTVDLPPQGCGYVSPSDLHMMIDGLPPGTEIHIDAQHAEFFNIQHSPGGPLGGEHEQFQSIVVMKMQGTGELATYQRNLTMQAQCGTSTAPRTPGTPVQSFDTQMDGLQGQLPPGDPDFDLLRITAGNTFGMPSPGHTTLSMIGPSAQLAGDKTAGAPMWNVHSFFDITYRIDFIGAPGGPFAGKSGSTTGTIRMQTGQPTTGVGDVELPRTIKLSTRPNPFGLSTGTTVEYRLPATAHVEISVFDASGHRVRQLANEMTPAGPHAMKWDGRNDAGRRMSSGTYFVKLSLNGKLAGTLKTTLVR